MQQSGVEDGQKNRCVVVVEVGVDLTVGFLDDSAIGQFVNGAGDCASFGAAGGKRDAGFGRGGFAGFNELADSDLVRQTFRGRGK
ncbi:hypothetical protein MAV3388_03660 [Mycobacterium avium subsp. hominissuis 3388]|nr:hypothetical protein O984_17040 [Mycobacterium avium 05-4293]KDP02319.1 hypothetical protein MAV3388_03660 [Mycobacterium avium subsp. hominissuis 3388]